MFQFNLGECKFRWTKSDKKKNPFKMHFGDFLTFGYNVTQIGNKRYQNYWF
jgi:hypothetical protein